MMNASFHWDMYVINYSKAMSEMHSLSFLVSNYAYFFPKMFDSDTIIFVICT